MPDKLTPAQRRTCMSRNRGTDTRPEMIVRRLIFSMGYRYRLHYKSLPGKPDIVFPGRKKVIFVNGCYWHRHNCKKGGSFPATNKTFWHNKFSRTKARDKQNLEKLRILGWDVLVVWECEIKTDCLRHKLADFLESSL
jgi:DNA mismatch endonuclease, patch repair protein